MSGDRKLVIQVPCFNEEECLPETLRALPRVVAGFTAVEVLVVDDGSADGTAAAARRAGADHVVVLPEHRGLAAAFAAGLAASLAAGADVVVNTDADNQYEAADVAALVAPVVDGRADLVVGSRPIDAMPWFPWWKRGLQRVGTRVVCALGRVRVADATSGFRAWSRDAAAAVRVHSRYTYTLETLIQAGLEGRRVTDVPIRVRPTRRESRLIQSNMGYVLRNAGTILSTWWRYRGSGRVPG